MENRYSLRKYKTKADRLNCPACNGKKTFAPYVDNETGQIIDESCGRCNRSDSCGHHLPPREYFERHPDRKEGRPTNATPLPRPPDKRTIYIPADAYTPSLDARHRPRNAFWQYLAAEFGAAPADAAFDAYRLGTSAHYGGGACVFPLFDAKGCASAQIIKVDAATGRTVRFTEGRATTWLHSVLARKQPAPQWLQAYTDNADKFPFCFGLHLALMEPDRTVCMVESAKTAVVQSLAMPAFLWLAVGSKDYLNPARLQALKGRAVLLVPDGGKGVADWTARVPLLRSHGFNVDAVDLGLPDGDDIADIRPDTAPETALGDTQAAAATAATPPQQEAATSPIELPIACHEAARPSQTPPDYPAEWDAPYTGPLPGYAERQAAYEAKVSSNAKYINPDAEGCQVRGETPLSNVIKSTPHMQPGPWASYMANEPLPGLWDVEIAAVEAVLEGRELSPADALFVSGHMGFVKGCNGRRVYRPYLDRLLAFAAGLADAPVVPLDSKRRAVA